MKDFKNLGPLDYLSILWRRKWYALIAFVLVSAGFAVYAWYVPQVYRADALIVAEAAAISEEYVRQTDGATANERIAAIRLRVQSRSFLEQMIQDQQMFGYPNGPEFAMDTIVAALQRNIQVSSPGGNVVTISCSASEPQAARDLVKALADRLVQSGVSQSRTRAVETNRFIDEQLQDAEKSLADLELKIKDFKLSHLGELPEQGNANMSALTALQSQLVSGESAVERYQDQKRALDLRAQERKRLQTFLQERKNQPGIPDTSGKVPPPSSVADNPQLVARKAQLAELMARYTPSHPDVVRLAKEIDEMERQLTSLAAAKEALTPLGPELSATEASKITDPKMDAADLSLQADAARDNLELQSIARDLDKRQKEREEILKQIKIYQARLNLAPALEQELQGLARERETLQTQYSNLQAKKFQTQMTENLETNRKYESYRVLDDPVLPTKPVFPNKVQLVLIGLAVGMIAGVAAAFGREYLDATMGTEEDAARLLNLPVLVTLPELENESRRKRKGLPGHAA